MQQRAETVRQTGSADQQGLAFTPSVFALSPFSLLQRFFTDDVADLFVDASSRRIRPRSRSAGASLMAWTPKVDVLQQSNELVIRADLPGVNPEDVAVEVGDDAVTISGERRQEHADERGGVYRYERSYGAFYRVIALPKGAITDRATARFKNGVLEITIPAPPEQVARGRRLEINQGSAQQDAGKDASPGNSAGSGGASPGNSAGSTNS